MEQSSQFFEREVKLALERLGAAEVAPGNTADADGVDFMIEAVDESAPLPVVVKSSIAGRSEFASRPRALDVMKALVVVRRVH